MTTSKIPLPDYVLESCARLDIRPEDIQQYTLKLPEGANDACMTLRIMTRTGQIFSRLIPIYPPTPMEDRPARPPRKTPSHTRKG